MAIAMTLALLAALSWRSSLGLHADLHLQKSLYAIRGKRKPPPSIVIVSIDDLTYKTLGLSPREPIPRMATAMALQRVHDDGARLVLLDFFFPKEEKDPAANIALFKALKSGPSVIARNEIIHPSSSDDFFEKRRIAFEADERFRQAASMEIPFKGIVALENAFFLNQNFDRAEDEVHRLPMIKPLRELGKIKVSPPDLHALINFYGAAGSIRRISASELIGENSSIAEGFFLNNIVFLGFQSEVRGRGNSDKEVYQIPSSDRGMFGVEIQATIAANLVDNTWLRRLPNDPFDAEHFLLVTLSFFLLLGIISLKPAQAFIYLLGFLGLWYGVTYLAFAQYYYFIPGVFLLLIVAPLVLAVAGVITALSALKELQETKRMLGVQTAEGAAKSGTWFGK